MVRRMLQHIDPRKLKEHPLSKQVFTTRPTPSFLESVKLNGVMEPLLVNSDLVIISGRRRKLAAIATNQKEVPIIKDTRFDDEQVGKMAILLCNRDRHELTNEERGRMAIELKKLYAIFAKRRQKLGTKAPLTPEYYGPELSDVSNPTVLVPGGGPVPREALTPHKQRRTSIAVAKELGLSTKATDASIKAVQAIDEAEHNGDTSKAQEIRKTLEGKSPAAAARKAKPPAKATQSNKLTGWPKHAEGIMRTCDTILHRIDHLEDELGRDSDIKRAHGMIAEARKLFWKVNKRRP